MLLSTFNMVWYRDAENILVLMSWLLLVASIERMHRRPKTLSQKNPNSQTLSNVRKCVLHYCKPWHFFWPWK